MLRYYLLPGRLSCHRLQNNWGNAGEQAAFCNLVMSGALGSTTPQSLARLSINANDPLAELSRPRTADSLPSSASKRRSRPSKNQMSAREKMWNSPYNPFFADLLGEKLSVSMSDNNESYISLEKSQKSVRQPAMRSSQSYTENSTSFVSTFQRPLLFVSIFVLPTSHLYLSVQSLC